MIYYAVSGANAFGVYTNLEWAKNISQYIYDPMIVQCGTKELAFCMARDNYNDCQYGGEVEDPFYGDSLDITLNHVLFKREIRLINSK